MLQEFFAAAGNGLDAGTGELHYPTHPAKGVGLLTFGSGRILDASGLTATASKTPEPDNVQQKSHLFESPAMC
jgi:hypothetical protein